MFDIGFAEILIVAIVALIVLGPEKLPTAAKTVGLWVGRIRRTLGSIQSEITEELRVEELRRSVEVSKEQVTNELNEMRTPFTESLNGESLNKESVANSSNDTVTYTEDRSTAMDVDSGIDATTTETTSRERS